MKNILLPFVLLIMIFTLPVASSGQPKPVEYYNLGGTVFFDTYPAPEFHATLTYNYSDIFVELSKTYFDTLGYYFYLNLPNGNYLVKAEPMAPGDWVPTYFGDVIHWEEAPIISLFSDQFNNDIQMIPAAGIPQGPGTITGTVNTATGSVSELEILLISISGTPLSYRLTGSSGQFCFENVAWGTYILHPEMPGKHAPPIYVTIDDAHPSAHIGLNMLESEIVAAVAENAEATGLTVSAPYPSPAGQWFNIDYTMSKATDVTLRILDLSGKVVFSLAAGSWTGQGQYNVDVSGLAAGSYFVSILPEGQAPVIRKLSVVH